MSGDTNDDRISMLIDAVEKSMAETVSTTESRLTSDILSIEGYSGNQYKRFMNRLLSKDIIKNYLEIGVWKGSTAIASLYGNIDKLNYWLIDNWCQFGGPRTEFVNNFLTHIKQQPNLIDTDCFGFNPVEKGMTNIDLYFYDGEHEEEDHYNALKHYNDVMNDSFIFVVDDWSWPKPKAGTYRAIADLNLKIEKKIEIEGETGPQEWWLGCGIFVLSKIK